MTHLTRGLFIFVRRIALPAGLALIAWSAPAIASAQSITPSANIALPGQVISFTVVGPAGVPTIIHFGDGFQMDVGPAYPAVVMHSYGDPGTFSVTLFRPGNPLPIATTSVRILNPATFSLTANPSSVIAGQAVNFTATTGAPLPGAFVDFGDGQSAPAPAGFNQIPHRYQNPGVYTARLLVVGQGVTFASAVVSVSANPVNVPVGQVYSSFLVGSPVLAGADTSIALTYRIFTPFVLGPTGVSPLQAIVELADTKGNVIQRSDPFALPFTQQNVNSVQTVMIPYTVPADAGGNYVVRVYVRVNQGGTVAVGLAQPLQIIGGPDPAPHINNAFHASGAILTNSGTNRGGYNVNLGMTTAVEWSTEELLLTGLFDPVSKKVDPLVVLQSATPAPITAPDANAAPASTTTQGDSGHVPAPPTNSETPSPAPQLTPSPGGVKTPEPSSATAPATKPPQSSMQTSATDARSDSIAATSATPQPTPSPAGPSTATGSAAEQAPPAVTPPPTPAPAPAPAPATPSLTFKDVVGRTDAAMPSVIGSKETIRGVDATYALMSGWTFHGGGGYFQLPSQDTTERTGELLDVIKAWEAGADSFRVAFSRNQDNVNKFVQTGTMGPLDVSAGVFEWTEQLTPHLRALLTGGRSNAQPETGSMPAFNDSVDQTDLTYTLGATSLDVQYHNAGPQFGTLSGASALSDRAGGAAALNLQTSPISTLAVTYGHD
ncbi:MAG TPA: hypothetical protein VGX02_06895, partial [Candidatus Eremiobacteraceae bacterium]|nr:hypothetical protein [Candidatus Eremiobacteraceae bacterium]